MFRLQVIEHVPKVVGLGCVTKIINIRKFIFKNLYLRNS
jgi:hypothetical protein